MPEGVLMTEIEIITDGDRRLHWSCGQSPDRERDTGSASRSYSWCGCRGLASV